MNKYKPLSDGTLMHMRKEDIIDLLRTVEHNFLATDETCDRLSELLETSFKIVELATNVHPYSKNPREPETFTPYNQGWNDACDYINDKLDGLLQATNGCEWVGRVEDDRIH